MTHGVYHYLVRNFDDFLALQDPTWYADYSKVNTITDEIMQELTGQLGHRFIECFISKYRYIWIRLK